MLQVEKTLSFPGCLCGNNCTYGEYNMLEWGYMRGYK